MVIAVVAALIAVLSLSLVATAQQQAPSADRLFSPETVEPGGQVTVTINITNFQLGMAVVETLPDGFTYVSDSLSDGTIQVAGQDLQIIPGSADFTYEVSASDTPGSYPFRGTVRDLDRVSHDIEASSVTVEAEPTPAPTTPSASRSFSPETVEPGGQVTVTINITNFQLGMAVVETLPDGFTYVSESLSDGTIQVTGQDLQIIPGSADFTYEVSASDTPGSYPFRGTVRDLDRVSHDIEASSVTVEAEPTPVPTTPSASRSFSPETVEPGGQVTVTINITNFQLGMAVVETLPDGFTYVSESLSDGTIQVTGQDLQIIPGSADFTYEVSASDTPGSYAFRGTVRDLDRVSHDIDDSTFTVAAASRSLSPETVEPGGQVTVTINITNFQLGMAVVETLPDGFTYVSDSLSDGTIEVDGQDLQIIPGSADFTYEVSASDTPGSYPFRGTVRDLDRVSHDIEASSVTVEAKTIVTPTPEPTPTDDMKPDVSWNVPQELTLEVRVRPIRPITEDDIASYIIEKGQLPKALRLDKTTGVITGRPVRESSAATTVTIKVTDTSGNDASFELRFPPVRDRTVEEDAPTPTLPAVPPIDLSGVTVGDAAPSSGLQLALAATGGALLLGGIGVMTARRRIRARARVKR